MTLSPPDSDEIDPTKTILSALHDLPKKQAPVYANNEKVIVDRLTTVIEPVLAIFSTWKNTLHSQMTQRPEYDDVISFAKCSIDEARVYLFNVPAIGMRMVNDLAVDTFVAKVSYTIRRDEKQTREDYFLYLSQQKRPKNDIVIITRKNGGIITINELQRELADLHTIFIKSSL